jgi:hypothetical protein
MNISGSPNKKDHQDKNKKKESANVKLYKSLNQKRG